MTTDTDIDDRRLQAVVDIGDHSLNAVLIFSASDLSAVYANNSLNKLLGLETGARPDLETLLQKVIREDRIFVRDMIARSLASNHVDLFEFRLSAPNEGERFLSCSAYKILSDRYLVAVIVDNTEGRQHESYLVEFGAKKNTLLDALTHNLSGALRLTQHLSTAAQDQLQRGTGDVGRLLELMHANNNHCLEIINDLLKEEHLKSPDISVKKTRVDVVEICRYILEELKNSHEGRIFNLQTTASPLYLNTDEVKLLQIVNNLAANAIKFSLTDQPVMFSVIDTNGVIITVEDFGIGIPPDLQPYIFDRQSIARRPGLNGEPSTGVGLYVSKKLAELIGASIAFRSVEGKGSAFSLSFAS